MKRIFILILFLSILFEGYCQVTFNRTYGFTPVHEASSVVQTPDGGYAICGKAAMSGPNRCFLLRTNAYGDSLWIKYYKGAPADFEAIFKLLPDSGFIICSNMGAWPNQNIYLIRTNEAGDTLWTRTIAGGSGSAIESAPDGGFIIGGSTGPSGVKWETLVLKTDSEGAELWRKIFHPYGSFDAISAATAIQPAPAGGYIVGGNWDFRATYGYTNNIYLIRLNSAGDSIWGKLFNYVNEQAAYSVHPAGSGFMIGGIIDTLGANNYHDRGYLIRTDAYGDTLWTHAQGYPLGQGLFALRPAGSDAFIGCGYSGPNASEGCLLEKFDSLGGLLWSRTFANTQGFGAGSVATTSDGGFVLCGNDNDLNSMVLIKTNANGQFTGVDDPSTATGGLETKATPNPFRESVTLWWILKQGSIVTVDLLDSQGRLISTLLNEETPAGEHKLQIDGINLKPGIYFCRIYTPGESAVQSLYKY
jgi:hypothetical protein